MPTDQQRPEAQPLSTIPAPPQRPRSARARVERTVLVLVTILGLLVAFLVLLLTANLFAAAVLFIIILILGWTLSGALSSSVFDPLDEMTGRAEEFAHGRAVEFDAPDASEEVQRLATALSQVQSAKAHADEGLLAEESRQAQFVSDVSHEIRTPLTAIQGTAETLMDPDMPQSMRERFLSNIVDECQRLTRLANDLLTLNRIEGSREEVKLSRINLRDIAEATAITLEALLEEREVELTITGEAPDILGNTDRIRQVFTNLVENASRFAPENGHVRVELKGIEGKSVMAVSDDGPGFGDVDPSRLFDRFYRADSSRARGGRGKGGTGLGLAIVKAIVDEHDGTVEALNRVGGGAVFIIALPAIEE